MTEGGGEPEPVPKAEEDDSGWGCLLGIVLIVAGGAWAWFGPIDDWRSGETAKSAVEAYESGSYDDAEAKLEELLAKAPDEPKTLRAVGNLMRVSRPFRAFLAMKKLREAGEATRDDLRLFATLAQDVHKTHLAGETTKELFRAEPDNPDNLFLEARGFFLDFRWGEALAKAEAILGRRPTHRPTRLLRASLLVRRPELVVRLQGKTELNELADEERDRVGLQALVLIAEARWEPVREDERNATLLRIANHPLAFPGQSLRAHGNLLGVGRLNEETMTVLLDRFGKRPALLGPWLAGRGLFDEALSLFSVNKAKERPELFSPWLGVLLHPSPQGREERLKKAGRLLVGAKGMMPEARHYLLGAILLRVRDSREGMRKLFRKSFAESESLPVEKRSGFLDVLAFEALISGERDFALKVMEKRFTDGIGEDAPYEACERYFLATIMNKRTEEGLAIAEQIKRRFPAQFAVRNNVAYLKLLLKRNVEETARELDELTKEGPPLPTFRATLALARLRVGKAKEALAVITEGGAPIYRDDADKAVCVAILRANGKGDTAMELAKSVRVDRLLPEEATLLEYVVDKSP
jgi:predicted Zn-dependent protease